MTRYKWVASRKAEGFPTAVSCRVAGVSRQAFYDWSARQAAGPSPAELASAELVEAIKQAHADSGGAYGSPRVTAELKRRGRRVNHKRVERLMRLCGICGIHKRRKPRQHRSGGTEHAPSDLVRRDFRPGTPDHTWAGDITYIPTSQGWLHLAVVLDVGSRRLIGYSMADHTRAELVVDALDTAAATRGRRTAGVIFHSDRGPQYLSREHASALRRHKMRHSVGRVANCWDNSVAESFFSTLKRELVSQTRFATRDQARREIFAWIGRYNTRRIHSTLNYQTPTEWENHHRQRLNQAA
ncbi:MAG: IS3 family transposase [bacterium]|nr:IS3 family transposase [bacterium]